MTFALAIPPLTVKNRGCALIWACALNRKNMVCTGLLLYLNVAQTSYYIAQPLQKNWNILPFKPFQYWGYFYLNPFTLRAAKTGQTLLEIFYLQKHFLEKIWRRNVFHKPSNNSTSNILWSFALFASYFRKYESSRRHFPEELWVWMG